MPTATTNLVSGPFVCGADGEVQLTITNPNTDTDQNKYTDLSVGFETCETENLAITQVMVGTNMLPVNTFSWVGDDLNIDFSALPVGMDLDGPGGLEDLDGDGIFDDIAGGTTIPISLFLGVACGVDLPDPLLLPALLMIVRLRSFISLLKRIVEILSSIFQLVYQVLISRMGPQLFLIQMNMGFLSPTHC